MPIKMNPDSPQGLSGFALYDLTMIRYNRQYRKINSIAKIHIMMFIFLNLPQMAFRTTYEIIPIMIPSDML